MTRGGRGKLRLEHGRHESDRSMLVKLTLSIFTLMFMAGLLLSTSPEGALSIPLLGSKGGYSELPRITSPDEYWDVVAREDRVMMYFAQALCPGCKKIEPSIKRLASEMSSEIAVYKVDLDAIAERYGYRGLLDFVGSLGVRGTPTLIIYINGQEVARHEGTFGWGDQYGPLREFVEAALEGREFESLTPSGVTTGLDALARATSPLETALLLGASLLFGLVAAVSPCSLPMVTAFASMSDESRRFKGFVGTLASVAAISFAAGSILALIYVVGNYLVPVINPGVVLIYLASAFIMAWGLMSLAGREPVLAFSSRARMMLPVLGLQCSLPFLIAVVALAGRAPHLALGASLLFAAGYGLPYALAASFGGGFIARITSMAGHRPMQILQGLVLVAAAAYLYWTVADSLVK